MHEDIGGGAVTLYSLAALALGTGLIVWLFWRGIRIARGQAAQGAVAQHMNWQLFRIVGTIAVLLLLGGGIGMAIGSSIGGGSGADSETGKLQSLTAWCTRGGDDATCKELCRRGQAW